MKICHLAKYYHPACGGIETVVRETAEGLSEGGHEVTVACINHRDRRGADVNFRPLALTTLAEETDGPVTVHRFGRIASVARCDVSLKLPVQLSRLLGQGFDIVHLHEPNPTMTLGMLPWLMASKRSCCPVVVTYHSDVCKPRRLGELYSLLQSRVLCRADRILCASRRYAGSSPVLRRIPARVDIVPFGINLDRHLSGDPDVEQVAYDLRRRHGAPLWLMVGRLVYYKGHKIALRALTHVPGKLVIIGSGPLEPELRALAARLGVVDRVIWLGNVPTKLVMGAYRAATALWFPSTHRSEAFGLAQVEAMANGCPVINTEIPGSGVPEVSLHHESGLTVACGDPESLAAAAAMLSEDTDLREELALGARQRACREFDRVKMLENLCSIYESVLRHHRPGITSQRRHRLQRRDLSAVKSPDEGVVVDEGVAARQR